MKQSINQSLDMLSYKKHAENTARYSSVLMLHLSKENPEITLNYQKSTILAAKWHDVGKSQIPASIVFNARRLSQNEFNLMKTHPLRGVECFKNTDTQYDTATQKIIIYATL
ncbi:hypothetical protein [Vibrio rumoiensis]|uniref:HD-GYP domain-containing protein n=1 Tax=Vibrio rumoiensis 1S-45 TaxID=1188252 RepID=A0A1E5E2J3_9VIBR|nr:hypothetical protein [Vibrio rumoiensis]OEF25354.1 hypothetical protein A1QC_09095 [Vibrio rumoiensis 1S-45]